MLKIHTILQKILPFFYGIILLVLTVTVWGIAVKYDALKEKPSNNVIAKHLVTLRENTKMKARMITLNHLMPSFVPLVRSIDGQQPMDAIYGRNYINYYERVAESFPGMADAHALLGFLYYQMGREQDAITSYERANAINPSFFWSHYNLGMLYYKQGNFEKALMSFIRALETSPEVTVKIIFASKIYQQIMLGVDGFQYRFDLSLRDGYATCQHLVSLIREHYKNGTALPAQKIFTLKVF